MKRCHINVKKKKKHIKTSVFPHFLHCKSHLFGSTWMSQELRINGDRINGLFHLLIIGQYIGVKNLTFDPSTSILAGHPSQHQTTSQGVAVSPMELPWVVWPSAWATRVSWPWCEVDGAWDKKSAWHFLHVSGLLIFCSPTKKNLQFAPY